MTKPRPVMIGILAIALIACLLPQNSTSASSTPVIAIVSPGDGSVLTSPIHLVAELNQEVGSLVRITLVNDNHLTISRKLLRIDQGTDGSTQFETDLVFEIPTETTEALLTVSTLDDNHRLVSLRSVAVQLAAEGQSTVQAQMSNEPWLVIEEPKPLAALEGGQITVSGTIDPVNDNPIRLDLIKPSGAVIGSIQLLVTDPGETITFTNTLPYAFINATTDIRLVIRQLSDDFATDVILDSVPIFLSP
ncbi:MAG: hypothetical protein H0S79_06670 [Anaerolineaceae bacterium]|nr:hypothetical protein [Anaerolineaceae bacterium]